MFSRLVIVLVCLVAFGKSSVFDEELYEHVLDPVLCYQQLSLISNDTVGLLRFIDASGKIPTGILQGNLNDLGDYHVCLGIDEMIHNQRIRGKYCSISIPLPSSETAVNGTLGLISPKILDLGMTDASSHDVIVKYNGMKHNVFDVVEGRRAQPKSPPSATSRGLTLGVCVPRACLPTQALRYYLDQLPLPVSPDDKIVEHFCRLPGDKPFSAGDYFAIALFSLLGLLTIISTSFDLYCTFILNFDRKRVPRHWSLFSVYTNTHRFMTTSAPGALDCLDGVRAISMLWVILGHTFVTTMNMSISNLPYVLEFMQSYKSVWVTAGPISVDTFFLLSGILCVYSTMAKFDNRTARFVKAIPVFYLHRLLRMLPLLATMVLLQASLVNHLSDGPQWTGVATAVQACRNNWWLALLHVQNYETSLSGMCLSQTWYLSVDVQLYMACPLVLVFLSGRRVNACLALSAALLLTLATATFYCFYYNFPAAMFQMSRINEIEQYTRSYYMNTLTRASPFAVGMIYGYALHLYREKKVTISTHHNLLLWLASLSAMALAVFQVPALSQPGHDNQLVDNLVNAYIRPLWAAALGFVIFACVQGYGGPVNWFLSLRVWKLPARLSYAMYLTHYSLMYVTTGSVTQTHRFGVGETLYRFSADLVWTVIASFVLSIFIDAPFSTMQKMLFGVASKPKKQESFMSVTVLEEDKDNMKKSAA